MMLSGRARNALLIGATVLLPLGVWVSIRVLEWQPKSKILKNPRHAVLCTMKGLAYSEGAQVKTASGMLVCRVGRWEALKSP